MITSDEIREKYLKFFEGKSHKRISPAPLVLEGDTTTLFTSAGMQPLIPYLKGKVHPDGKRLVDSQPSIRLQDIEEVGDNCHTTFFEMLGNWSLGDYFKKEQLGWILEFFIKELGIPKDKLWVSVFEGTAGVPRDKESYQRWLELGIPKERIHFYGVEKNWWSRSGTPREMPAGEIGGPDSEIFYDFGEELETHTDKDSPCHPNCQCGRFLEIGNSVFIQYEKQENGSLKELPQKNVDFGGGLERITAAVNGDPDIFNTDFFIDAKNELEDLILKKDKGYERSVRIILDHLRASMFIISDGIEPMNKSHGYVLRRLIRRMTLHAKMLNVLNADVLADLNSLLINLGSPYGSIYPNVVQKRGQMFSVIQGEIKKFEEALGSGPVIKEIESMKKKSIISGERAFDYYQTYGWPLEVIQEFAEKKGVSIDIDGFNKAKATHQEKSRTASSGMFKGGLADTSGNVTKLHTATHLLHAALRKVLGEHVSQKGSNITVERLRFDFSHPQKLTDEEIVKVEALVNGVVEKDLPVGCETMSLDKAIKEGALHFFAEKYGERVKVYTIGSFSKEVCGGPHVGHTGEIGHVRIIKQEKVGSGIIRIYATNKK